MHKRKKIFKVLRTVFYAIFVLIMIAPVFIMLSSSLQTYYEIVAWPPRLLGEKLRWENYREVIWGNISVVRPMMNSLVVSVSTAFLATVIGIWASYAVSRYRFRFKGTFMTLILVTQMFSPVLLSTPMYIIFRRLGLLNTRLALVIANTAVALPMTVYLLSSYLDGIPISMEEAAWMDGCSKLQGIRYVVAPVLRPGLITTALFAFIMAWGDLVFAKSFLVSPELKTISLVLTDFKSLYKTTWETQMAASVLSVLPTFVIFVFIQKYLIKGLTSAGVKG